MVLVQAFIDVGDLALAEGVAEGVVDVLEAHAEAAGGIAVDDDVAGQAAHLLIRIDVAQFRDLGEALLEDGGPVDEVGQIVGLQRVLVLRAAKAASDGEILNSLQIEGGTRNVRTRLANARNYL